MAGVVGVLQEAIMGQAAALLVSGEAGVGKTVLVRAACSQVSDVAEVIWGSCLPLTSLAVPFLPLRSGLREWAGSHAIPVPGESDGPATG
jgi:DNA replication protein DnaC